MNYEQPLLSVCRVYIWNDEREKNCCAFALNSTCFNVCATYCFTVDQSGAPLLYSGDVFFFDIAATSPPSFFGFFHGSSSLLFCGAFSSFKRESEKRKKRKTRKAVVDPLFFWTIQIHPPPISSER